MEVHGEGAIDVLERLGADLTGPRGDSRAVVRHHHRGIRDAAFHEVGDVLFAAVNVARKLHVDPELALRAASTRFRGRVEAAEQFATRVFERSSAVYV